MYSCSTYNSSVLKKLQGISVGNGIGLHPKERLLLISKPGVEYSEQGKSRYRIFQMTFKNGEWCCEKEVGFSGHETDYHPVFTPDGRWVYFNSDRPPPNTTSKSEKMNIWRVPYEGGKWGLPEYLYRINTEYHESYPSISGNGTLYFNSDRPGGKGSMDIYSSKLAEYKFQAPEPVLVLNSPDSENDLIISPDERFIIFNRYHFASKEVELYISKNKNGRWSNPEPLDVINQANIWELTPAFSPDGRYFLYEVNGKIQTIKKRQIIK